MKVTPEQTARIDAIETAFLAGDLEALRGCACPICDARLLFSVSPDAADESAAPGRRRRGSVHIYCTGACNTMLARVQARIPAWAEQVDDWARFSETIGTPSLRSAGSNVTYLPARKR